jgi:hypothetical protein
MPRMGRFLRKYECQVYHVISRTALPGLPIDDADKDHLLRLIQHYSKLFFLDVLVFRLWEIMFILSAGPIQKPR